MTEVACERSMLQFFYVVRSLNTKSYLHSRLLASKVEIGFLFSNDTKILLLKSVSACIWFINITKNLHFPLFIFTQPT